MTLDDYLGVTCSVGKVGEHDNNAFGYSKAGLFLLAFACGEPRTTEHAD